MGFDDREIVTLSGAHALGRCHTDRSGYSGPWTFSPTVVTNDYFKLLLEEKWQWKKVYTFSLIRKCSQCYGMADHINMYSGTDPINWRTKPQSP